MLRYEKQGNSNMYKQERVMDMRIREIIVTHTRHKILQVLTKQYHLHSFHSYLLWSSGGISGDLPPFQALRVAFRYLPGRLGLMLMLALHNLFHFNLDSRRNGDDAALRLRFEQRNHIALRPMRRVEARLDDPRGGRDGVVDIPAGRLEFNLRGQCCLLATLLLVEFRLSEDAPDRDCTADEVDYGSRELQRRRSTGLSRGKEPNHDGHTQYRCQPEISGKGYFYANVSE